MEFLINTARAAQVEEQGDWNIFIIVFAIPLACVLLTMLYKWFTKR